MIPYFIHESTVRIFQSIIEIFIYRGELYRKIHAENVKAAGNQPDDLARAEEIMEKEMDMASKLVPI